MIVSGIRQSFVYSLEADGHYGEGKCSSYKWVAPPPGSYFNSTHNRQTSRIQSTGSKYWDTVAYGALSGQWEWTFTMDYKYLTPFLFVFERYQVDPVDASGNPVADDAQTKVGYRYSFSKVNYDKVPSFTVRRKILNYMAGGPVYSDEMVELRGCVCKSFRFSKSEGSSQVNVTMTGFYADEKMVTGELSSTDYQDYTGALTEWMCMYISDDGTNYDYMANTDNLGVSVENNAAGVFNTCSPFAKNYYEGLSNFSFTTSCYSTNPDQYKKRLYYGGYKGWTGSTDNATGQPLTARPQAKGMRPLPYIKLLSYNGSTRAASQDDEVSVTSAISSSNYISEFLIEDCVIKSMTWPKGNGGALQDSISGAECKKISLAITIKDDRIEFDPSVATVIHQVTSTDPVSNISRTGTECTTDN